METLKRLFWVLTMVALTSCGGGGGDGGGSGSAAAAPVCKDIESMWTSVDGLEYMDFSELTLDQDFYFQYTEGDTTVYGILHVTSSGEFAYCIDMDLDSYCDDVDEDGLTWFDDDDWDDIGTGTYTHECDTLTMNDDSGSVTVYK